MTNKKAETKTTGLIVSVNSKKLDSAFIKLENEIRTANKSFLTVGRNLSLINEGGMYKTRGFKTFQMYVETIFDFTRDNAYKLMNATRIYDLLAKNFKPSELPKLETHCRPLTKIEKDEDVIKIWKDVLLTNKIIARNVIEVVNQFLGKGAPTDTDSGLDTDKNTTGTDSGTVGDSNDQDEISAIDKVRILEAKVTQLENDLEKARAAKGGIAKTKMARKLIQAGFVALSNSITDDQKDELIATKKALLGYQDRPFFKVLKFIRVPIGMGTRIRFKTGLNRFVD